MDVEARPTNRGAASRLGALLGGQLRNIAPFITRIALVAFCSVASPSCLTLGNFNNILNQIAVTAIIAVGLTFVILCAEIDLSVASIANATGIVVAFLTLHESYVNIANVPLPGWAAIVVALACRSEDRRVGKEGVCQFRSWWLPFYLQKKTILSIILLF